MTLHDAIDQDVFIIDDCRFTDGDLQGMNCEDLETLKMRINKKISGISASIKKKQIDFADSGKRAPKNWYMNRKLALSINQRVLAYVNFLVRNRLWAQRSIGDFFINQAKRVLPTEQYQDILLSAQIEKETQGDTA